MTSMKPVFNNPIGGYSIVFSLDTNYLRPALTLIESIMAHAAPLEMYNFFILHEGISVFCRKVVEKYATGLNMTIQFIDVADLDIKGPASFHFSKAMYFRLLIPSLFRDWECILYLDVDMLAFSNIAPIFHSIGKDKAIAAVKDCFISAVFPGHPEKILKRAENYFNSGVIVFNCQRITEQDVCECLEKIGEYTLLPDQDILNYVYEGRVHFLSYSYNFTLDNGNQNWLDAMRKEERQKREKIEKPVLVHYTGHEKPWLGHWDDKLYFGEHKIMRECVEKKLEACILEVGLFEFP